MMSMQTGTLAFSSFSDFFLVRVFTAVNSSSEKSTVYAYYCLDHPTSPVGIICEIVSQHGWGNTHLKEFEAIEVHKFRQLTLDVVWGQYTFSSVGLSGFYAFSLQEAWQQFILLK